ncbi:MULTISPECIES: polysaccharide pyruvyl transferase family protein [Methanothermobacter]|uniref:Polysaccharide pyruvyl transferase family protein n=1 Tax=Methanothermobacter wolfeii TaxID=145261 RepID=A0A9E7RUG9_METWO|nr:MULTISPECIES: polysaccharide pyruvyl transferase family protein [Methanothermobacter]MDI6882036.1 polysaccharide pyruvyl transferase family protein [Methanothermobacter sp.]UXH32424.1 polysaccharide pyruvyl transferase family protein [Methanothermobacter wolfeii]
MKGVRFLLIGIECSRNKGTAAILKSTVQTLKNYFENALFKAVTPWPNRDKLNCKGIEFSDDLLSKLRLFKIRKESDDFDIVIDLHGDTISEDYGILTVFGFFYNIVSYKLLAKKAYVIYAQSLGPFNNPISRLLAKFCLNKVDLLIIREKITENYLKMLGIRNYFLGADPAFLLKTASKENIKEILKNEDIRASQGSIIGINVSQHIYDLLKDAGRHMDYIMMNAKLIDKLIETYDVNILLIPHVLNNVHDDYSIAKKVYSKIKNKNLVNVIEGDYTPEEVKGIIGLCDLFIGARMHAVIASTSQCIPSVGIAYSHKMHGIIGELLGLDEYIIDIDDLNYDILHEKTMKAWENRERIKKHLEKVIPEVKRKALKNGELVRELCDSLKIT